MREQAEGIMTRALIQTLAAAALIFTGLTGTGCITTADIPETGRLDGTIPAEDGSTPMLAEPLPYGLAPGDQLAIRLLEDDRLNDTVRVDSDGGFQFFYAGRVKVGGLTTTDVSKMLASALSEVYVDPNLSVNLVSQEQQYVSVLGEVSRPGRVQLRPGSRISEVLAETGGMTPDAAPRRVILIRRVAQDKIVAGKFDMREAFANPLSGEWANDIVLQRSDIIWVPRNEFAQLKDVAEFVSVMFGAAVDVERAIVLYPDAKEIIRTGEDPGRNTIIVR